MAPCSLSCWSPSRWHKTKCGTKTAGSVRSKKRQFSADSITPAQSSVSESQSATPSSCLASRNRASSEIRPVRALFRLSSVPPCDATSHNAGVDPLHLDLVGPSSSSAPFHRGMPLDTQQRSPLPKLLEVEHPFFFHLVYIHACICTSPVSTSLARSLNSCMPLFFMPMYSRALLVKSSATLISAWMIVSFHRQSSFGGTHRQHS